MWASGSQSPSLPPHQSLPFLQDPKEALGFPGAAHRPPCLNFQPPNCPWISLQAFNQEHLNPILPWLQRGMRDCQEPAAFQALLGLHMSYLI